MALYIKPRIDINMKKLSVLHGIDTLKHHQYQDILQKLNVWFRNGLQYNITKMAVFDLQNFHHLKQYRSYSKHQQNQKCVI